MTFVVSEVSIQAPKQVVMVRPHRFQSNPQTMADNSFKESLTLKTRLKVPTLKSQVR